MTSNSVLSLLCVLILFGFGMNLWGSVGCQAQQKANREAYDATWATVQAHEKWGGMVESMEYQREWIVVYIRPSADTLWDEKSEAVAFVAQTMGDNLKNHEANTIKELIVKGNIEDEELWVIRYDMATGQLETQKSRLIQTM